MKLLLRLSCVFLALAGAPAFAQEKVITERDLGAIVEEQALLERQLDRLKSTMEVLLQRIEAEGRTRTADLLRDGLALLQQRATSGGQPQTTEERMQEARAALASHKLARDSRWSNFV